MVSMGQQPVAQLLQQHPCGSTLPILLAGSCNSIPRGSHGPPR